MLKRKRHWSIMYQYGNQKPEKLEDVYSERTRDYLIAEYRMAFGSDPKAKVWVR